MTELVSRLNETNFWDFVCVAIEFNRPNDILAAEHLVTARYVGGIVAMIVCMLIVPFSIFTITQILRVTGCGRINNVTKPDMIMLNISVALIIFSPLITFYFYKKIMSKDLHHGEDKDTIRVPGNEDDMVNHIAGRYIHDHPNVCVYGISVIYIVRRVVSLSFFFLAIDSFHSARMTDFYIYNFSNKHALSVIVTIWAVCTMYYIPVVIPFHSGSNIVKERYACFKCDLEIGYVNSNFLIVNGAIEDMQLLVTLLLFSLAVRHARRARRMYITKFLTVFGIYIICIFPEHVFTYYVQYNSQQTQTRTNMVTFDASTYRIKSARFITWTIEALGDLITISYVGFGIYARLQSCNKQKLALLLAWLNTVRNRRDLPDELKEAELVVNEHEPNLNSTVRRKVSSESFESLFSEVE